MKIPPPGSYAYGVQSLGRWDGPGISYQRWNMTAGQQPAAPVLGSFAEVRIALRWPLLVSLVAAALWLMLLVKQRRLARSGRYCPNCGGSVRT